MNPESSTKSKIKNFAEEVLKKRIEQNIDKYRI